MLGMERHSAWFLFKTKVHSVCIENVADKIICTLEHIEVVQM